MVLEGVDDARKVWMMLDGVDDARRCGNRHRVFLMVCVHKWKLIGQGRQDGVFVF